MRLNQNQTFWGTIFFLGLAGIISWIFYYREFTQKDTIDIHNFPKTIGEWKGEDLPISEYEYGILETRNVLARKYIHPDQRIVYLLLVYSQHNRKVTHPPEICYTGGGISILENVTTPIEPLHFTEKIMANRLLLEYKGARQYAFYWFKVGSSYTPSYWKQQILIVSNILEGRSRGCALIRVSSDILDKNTDIATRNVTEFTNLLLPLLSTYLP